MIEVPAVLFTILLVTNQAVRLSGHCRPVIATSD